MSLSDDIKAALSDVGTEFEGAPLVCVLRKMTQTGSKADPRMVPTYEEVTGYIANKLVRTNNEDLVPVNERRFTFDATGSMVPAAGDYVAVGYRETDLDSDTLWAMIATVTPVEPFGVPYLYKTTLQS